MTLLPAYGRDYTRGQDAIADWHAGKEFKTANGGYINKEDVVSQHISQDIWIRYNSLRSIVKITEPPSEPLNVL